MTKQTDLSNKDPRWGTWKEQSRSFGRSRKHAAQDLFNVVIAGVIILFTFAIVAIHMVRR